MTQLESFAKSLHVGLFASRNNPSEGLAYAYDVIGALPKEVQIYAFTALHVAINSISDELLRINDNGNANHTDQASADEQDAGAEFRYAHI